MSDCFMGICKRAFAASEQESIRAGLLTSMTTEVQMSRIQAALVVMTMGALLNAGFDAHSIP
jgi:hypothetical protein